MTEEEIKEICKKYNIENYTINSDMSIDVDGNVTFIDKKLDKIPLQFNKVTGNFNCGLNTLRALEGCPNYVGGYFVCDENNLDTLEYCPNYIGGGISCVHNCLTTLQHLPINFYVGGGFLCGDNFIEPIEFSRLFFGTINGYIYTGHDNLNEFLNKHKNPPKKDLPRILSALRKLTL